MMGFKSDGAKRVIKYIGETYGAEPEFLWAKYPSDAIFRHDLNGKWFAALLTVGKDKLGFKGTDEIEILDLKCDPLLIDGLMGNDGFLPGYHMNKKYWITILLDGSVPDDKIFGLIDLSYDLTKKKIKSLS